MKTKVLIVLLFAFASVLECKGQFNGDKAILVGTVRADGHQKATKGAFWKVRPEAKLIYEGGRPTGYPVYVLDRPSFVRYIEHNNSDDNYIVFEKGAVVYTDASGQFYDSYCGNKIEYIGPVERFIVQEKVVSKETIDSKSSQSETGSHNVADYGKAPVPPKQPTPAKIEIKERSKLYYWQKRNWWIYPASGLVFGTATGFVFPKNGYIWYGLFPKDGSRVTNSGHDDIKTPAPDEGGRVTNPGHY